MNLLNYYEESRTKQKGREKILKNSSEYFKNIPAEIVTMKELADYLNIERRTLYHYYNNKTDLIVDVSLYNAEKYLEWQDENNKVFLEQYESETTRVKLLAYFKHFMKSFISQEDHTKQVSAYDSLINSLEKDSETYKRFVGISNQLRHHSNVALDIIKEGIEAGMIKTRGNSAEKIYAIIDQSFRAYFFKSLGRMERTDHYSIENVENYLEILVDGLCIHS